MLSLNCGSPKTILCLGAHADDIEIGCGGTILNMLAEREEIDVTWVVLGARDERAEEARRSAESFLGDAARKSILIKSFRDSFFPYEGEEIKGFFNELRCQVSPDLIFTHRREDMHQDHRLVAELTWNTFRNHLVLEYEIPKYEGDLGCPNVFVPLSEAICQRKIDTMIGSFRSQHSKPWFTDDTFWALLRLRGVESNSPTRFAEALYCRKLLLGLTAPAEEHAAPAANSRSRVPVAVPR